MTSAILAPERTKESRSAVDPVCGMSVDPAQPEGGTFEHDGIEYAFCSPHCREKFRADSARFLEPKKAAPPSGQQFTCPMHPEIRQLGPGTCPLCGMALEPVEATATAKEESK